MRENEGEGCLVGRGKGKEFWWGPSFFFFPRPTEILSL